MTRAEAEKLRPCPFCGGEPIMLKDHKYLGIYVACESCSACTITSDRAAAVAAWNRRAVLPALEAALSENERLRKALIAAGRHVGAGLADDVSTDFLMLVPEEVRLVMERHRAATPTDRLGGGE